MFGKFVADKFAVLISQRDAGTHNIDAFAGDAAKIRCVTGGAVGLKKRLAPRQHVLRRQGPGELRESTGTSAASSSSAARATGSRGSASPATPSRRRRGGILRKHENGYRRSCQQSSYEMLS
jgi:hypothetical protein